MKESGHSMNWESNLMRNGTLIPIWKASWEKATQSPAIREIVSLDEVLWALDINWHNRVWVLKWLKEEATISLSVEGLKLLSSIWNLKVLSCV